MKTLVTVAAAAVVLTLGAAIFLTPSTPASPPQQTVLRSSGDQLVTAIDAAQDRLRRLPGDWETWAQLGLAYVERARVTADPAYYPKAEGALQSSVKLRPAGNVSALIGLGALANARHDFAHARDLARQALKLDAYSASALGVLADALTQLGDATAATDAVQRMLDTRPGLPAYARGAYDLEQHGRVAEARALWERALADVHSPADVAYMQVQLGDLAFHAGDVLAARSAYETALAADPASVPASAGLARVRSQLGQPSALDLWASVVARVPSPSYLIEYAADLRAAGRPYSAQLDLAAAGLRLFAASGGHDDLGEAELFIANGSYAKAVAAAKREYARRTHTDVASTLSWALHLAGDDASALRYARAAVALGSQNPVYAKRLREISAALGLDRTTRLLSPLAGA